MPRIKQNDTDLTAIRDDIASLAASVGRLETELGHTRAALRHKPNGNGSAHAAEANGNGHDHPIAEELLAGAAKFGGEAVGVAGEAMHAGTSWVDAMLRKN